MTRSGCQRAAIRCAKEKIDLIAKWIKEGAVLPAVAAVTPPTARPQKPEEAPKKEEKPAEVPLPKVAAAPKEAIDKLTAAGAQVMPLFAESSLLTVSFAHRSEPAGDAEVALLAGVAEQCYAIKPGRLEADRRGPCTAGRAEEFGRAASGAVDSHGRRTCACGGDREFAILESVRHWHHGRWARTSKGPQEPAAAVFVADKGQSTIRRWAWKRTRRD